ncbi:LysR family transcriptional regulator [Marinobacterium sp. D7]|uniref:LysR family transcriptional regulator n=1 Tax=Marinobacterium ramblicola TaxID=2849041 RepID=UPI001C2DD526|nr:LysR family transcriptional regulator [Marinobacterium ramblicola]MBV1787658.1 LysR family transcriptional regulator [Marinobacterium ramblicola]
MKIDLSKHLKINQLRLISAIAEYGQLSIAADELAVTQPAASRMLADIEQTIGAKLFERHAKGMEATLIGRSVAQRAHNMLVELRDLARDVDELQRGEGGAATVGAVTGAAVGYVIPAVRQLKAVSPKADIHVNVDTSDLLLRDLAAGKNDFVLARIIPGVDANEFEVHPAKSEDVRLVVREDHPLANAQEVSLKELTAYEWVIQSHRVPMRDAINNACLVAGIQPPDNIINSTSLLVMISILVSSSAIAPLASEVTDLLIGRQVGARLKVLPLREPIQMSPYYLLQMKGRQLSPVAARLRSLVAEELKRST